MKSFRILLLTFLFSFSVFAQNGFQFENGKSKITLSFELVNNLIIIPLKVNGVRLNFLLDTGVSQTLIFSLDDANAVSFTQSQSVKMKGFGNKDDFIAFKCKDNVVALKNYCDKNHTIYLVLDQEINISSQVGITVNGIIGYHFFKNNLVKINYGSKKITICKRSVKQLGKIEKEYVKIPITLESNKPYINCDTSFEFQTAAVPSKLLIDTGNSDALWLFKETDKRIEIPTKNIDDYLGRGLNGDVFGKRGRVKSLQISSFKINLPITSFPDSLNTNNIVFSENRVGSLGSEIVKRFNLVFDYSSSFLYLKKNNLFDDPFEYNKSGLEVQHQGLQWAMQSFETDPALNTVNLNNSGERIQNKLRYKFELKPVFVITHIRKDSPASRVGLLKDDLLLSINGNLAGNYKLQEIIELLKGDENKKINMQVDRNGKVLKFQFQLKSIL